VGIEIALGRAKRALWNKINHKGNHGRMKGMKKRGALLRFYTCISLNGFPVNGFTVPIVSPMI